MESLMWLWVGGIITINGVLTLFAITAMIRGNKIERRSGY